MAAEPPTDRSSLRFAHETQSRFSFLEALGFRCVRAESTFVRFESSKIALNVFHGRGSFEIGLELESTGSPTESYSIPEIVRLVDKEQGDQYKYYATRTPQGVVEGVKQLAEIFQRCIAAGILRDDQLFFQLRQQKEELATKYALEVELRQARRAVEAAWRTKDYMAVVEALKPLRAALTANEVRKLEFAEKQCGKSNR